MESTEKWTQSRAGRAPARGLAGILGITTAVAAMIAVAPATGVQAQDDQTVDAGVLRRMSLEELLDMDVTSASRVPEPYVQAAAALQVITQVQIRRSGATTIAEAIRLASNLHVAQKNAQTWAVSARGFNTDLSNKLLVLIDGRTVYSPLFSGVFWDRQDYALEDVDRIEVISGPGGTLWGANAVNGVINIITKRAEDTQGVFVAGGYGSQLDGLGTVRYGGSLSSGAYYRVYGKYFERAAEAFPDGSDAQDRWGRAQAGFRADVDLGERDLLTLQGDAYDSDQSSATTGRWGDVSGSNVLARWTRTFSAESDLSVQLYYDRSRLSLPTPEMILAGLIAAQAGTLVDELDTYDFDFQHHFRLGGRNRVVWGLGYRFKRNDVRNAPGLAFDPSRLDRSLYSAFVQNEVAVASRLGVTVGTKVEHNDYTGFELEPNARVTWSLAPTRSLWAAVSRAVRMPSRVDRHERLPTPGLSPLVDNLIVGNDTFESEVVTAYELGLRAQVGPSVAGSLSTFYNSYDRLRSTSMSPPDPVTQLPFPFYFANNLEATTYGTELSADVVLMAPWSVRLGYTYLHAEVGVVPGGEDFNNALNETADPSHQWFASTAVDLGDQIELDVAFRGIGSFTYNVSGVADEVPSYVEADARVGWHPTSWIELSVSGQNLLHDQHPEYVVSSPNPRAEIRRAVSGRVAIRW